MVKGSADYEWTSEYVLFGEAWPAPEVKRPESYIEFLYPVGIS